MSFRMTQVQEKVLPIENFRAVRKIGGQRSVAQGHTMPFFRTLLR